MENTQIRLEYEDGATNTAKFYEISVERSRYNNSEWDVITRWGRIGTDGQVKVLEQGLDHAEAVKVAKAQAEKKINKKGYEPVHGFLLA